VKLQQLRYFRDVVDSGFNLSKAAAALHTSQPGVSRHLQLLERALGVKLLARQSTRIAGLSDAGRTLLPAVRRLLLETENLQRQARELAAPGTARFVIATTHTHARHTLLPVLKRYIELHPGVALQLRQGSVPRISQLLVDEIVDIGVATEPADRQGLALRACYRYEHALIAPARHPLLGRKRVTLEDLARFPLITYDDRHRLGRVVREQFAARGIRPNIVMSIIDDDIMKSYVEAGFGLAILPAMAYHPGKDRNLRKVPVSHLFEPSTCYVMTKEGRYLERHVRDFIELIKGSPDTRGQ